MPFAILVIITIIFAILLLGSVYAYHTQRSALISILHLVSNLAQGQYARRTDPRVRGANTLADDLEKRAARAEENYDHLISLLTVLDHTDEIAIATDNVDIIRLANPATARVFERPLDTLLGRHIDTVIHHPDLRAL